MFEHHASFSIIEFNNTHLIVVGVRIDERISDCWFCTNWKLLLGTVSSAWLTLSCAGRDSSFSEACCYCTYKILITFYFIFCGYSNKCDTHVHFVWTRRVRFLLRIFSSWCNCQVLGIVLNLLLSVAPWYLIIYFLNYLLAHCKSKSHFLNIVETKQFSGKCKYVQEECL